MSDKHSEIHFDIDHQGVEDAKQILRHVKDGARTAIQRALNRAATGIKTDGARETSKTFFVDSDTVRSRMVVSKASKTNLSITVSRKGGRFLARNFPRDPNTMPGVKGGKAVFLRPRRDGGGMYLNADTERGKSGVSKAFMATTPSRGRSILRRIGKHRDRLTHARGLSVPEMLGDADVTKVIQAGAATRFNKELDHQVNHLLTQREGVSS